MADLAFLALLVAFFAVAVVFVRACDHIIGPDAVVTPVEPPEAAHDRMAA